MLKKINIKSKFKNVQVDKIRKNKITDTQRKFIQTIDFNKLDISKLGFRWFDDLSKESFHCEKYHFTNFLSDNTVPEICEKTCSNANLFMKNFRNVNSLKRCDKIRKIAAYRTDSRVRELFIYSTPLIREYFDLDVIYKVHPFFMNEKTGIRVFCCVIVDEADINDINYYLGIFLIDIYHLVIPSSYKDITKQEYKQIFYEAFKHANINIYDSLCE